MVRIEASQHLDPVTPEQRHDCEKGATPRRQRLCPQTKMRLTHELSSRPRPRTRTLCACLWQLYQGVHVRVKERLIQSMGTRFDYASTSYSGISPLRSSRRRRSRSITSPIIVRRSAAACRADTAGRAAGVRCNAWCGSRRRVGGGGGRRSGAGRGLARHATASSCDCITTPWGTSAEQ